MRDLRTLRCRILIRDATDTHAGFNLLSTSEILNFARTPGSRLYQLYVFISDVNLYALIVESGVAKWSKNRRVE
jgi:hypothetical protein